MSEFINKKEHINVVQQYQNDILSFIESFKEAIIKDYYLTPSLFDFLVGSDFAQLKKTSRSPNESLALKIISKVEEYKKAINQH